MELRVELPAPQKEEAEEVWTRQRNSWTNKHVRLEAYRLPHGKLGEFVV